MKSKRISLAIAVGMVSALVFAPASQANPRVDANKQAKAFAAKQCAAQANRAPKAFKSRYGKAKRAAMAACVRSGTEDLVAEVGTAVETCANELVSDPAGFLATDGKGSGSDSSDPLGVLQAFPNCVRYKLGSEIRARIDAFIAAGRACVEEARSNPEGFKETYGQGDGPLAAIGRCIDSRLAS
ncbi:MAG: hypothetical protein ACKOBH_02060 [bacterium]